MVMNYPMSNSTLEPPWAMLRYTEPHPWNGVETKVQTKRDYSSRGNPQSLSSIQSMDDCQSYGELYSTPILELGRVTISVARNQTINLCIQAPSP
jgi:hypothetical protein